MSLLFLEGFEHYGTGSTARSRMLAGLWAQVSSQWSIVNTNARTGSHSLSNPGISASRDEARLVFGNDSEIIGAGFGVMLPNLPAGTDRSYISFRSSSNVSIITLCLQSDGTIALRRGNFDGTLIEVSDTVLTAGTFHHIEVRSLFDSTVGEFELRVNGITQMQLGGLNLGSNRAVSLSFVATLCNMLIDDIFVWNGLGTTNNDFLGPLRVLTVYADSDGVPQDWSVVGATSAFDAVNDPIPDDDASYIGSTDAGDKATLGLPELPPEISAIAGIFVPVLARIDDAGTGQINVSAVSEGDSYYGGNATPLTATYTYWPFIFDYDPHTEAEWTKSAFEAASIQIEKII
jgi:hypothetical protein